MGEGPTEVESKAEHVRVPRVSNQSEALGCSLPPGSPLRLSLSSLHSVLNLSQLL